MFGLKFIDFFLSSVHYMAEVDREYNSSLAYSDFALFVSENRSRGKAAGMLKPYQSLVIALSAVHLFSFPPLINKD